MEEQEKIVRRMCAFAKFLKYSPIVVAGQVFTHEDGLTEVMAQFAMKHSIDCTLSFEDFMRDKYDCIYFTYTHGNVPFETSFKDNKWANGYVFDSSTQDGKHYFVCESSEFNYYEGLHAKYPLEYINIGGKNIAFVIVEWNESMEWNIDFERFFINE